MVRWRVSEASARVNFSPVQQALQIVVVSSAAAKVLRGSECRWEARGERVGLRAGTGVLAIEHGSSHSCRRPATHEPSQLCLPLRYPQQSTNLGRWGDEQHRSRSNAQREEQRARAEYARHTVRCHWPDGGAGRLPRAQGGHTTGSDA